MTKGLNLEQQQRFKELYLKGYSATMLFKELGIDYASNPWLANSRMRNYRLKFNLPKRFVGFQPSVRVVPNQVETLKKMMNKKRERIAQIKRLIPRWEDQIKTWKSELKQLEECSSFDSK